MAKAELKTKRSTGSVADFLARVASAQRRRECGVLVDLMRRVTRAEPVLWGSSIVGFGRYEYRYESGREGEWFLVGFSPRKQNLVVYVMAGFAGEEELLERLGKYKVGKSCLYLNKLEDVDLGVLRRLLDSSVKQLAGAAKRKAKVEAGCGTVTRRTDLGRRR